MMIRHMTLLAALGICLVGFMASPAARMTDSVPVYEKAAEMNALRGCVRREVLNWKLVLT